MFFSTVEKTKEHDHFESDGLVTLSSVHTASAEPENQELTNAEQLRSKSPDEVCAVKHDVV